jgi:hypothetical protein
MGALLQRILLTDSTTDGVLGSRIGAASLGEVAFLHASMQQSRQAVFPSTQRGCKNPVLLVALSGEFL